MKKVLFVTYYWPPAGGAPINRILKFYKYLPEFDWEPVILTVDKGDFPFVDHSLEKQVRESTSIYRARNFSIHSIFQRISPKSKSEFIPYGFTDHTTKGIKGKISRWVKYNFIPDTRILWKGSAYRKARQILSEHKIDLIFSSSPPQTNHIIAKKLARKYRIPWVADFRDPWTDVFWLNDQSKRLKLIHAIDKKMERNTIAQMDAVITVSPHLVSLLSEKTSKKIHLIYNGYDDEMFDLQKEKSAKDKFIITYAGSMSYSQKPDSFFRAIKRLSEDKDFTDKTLIRFMGNFPPFLHEMIVQSSLKDKIEMLEYTEHQQAVELIASSSLLLMIIPETPDNKGVVTSKLFDYLAVRVPILSYGPTDGDAAGVIETARAGKNFMYNDADNSAEFILHTFNNWKQNEVITDMNHEYIRSFSRKNLTRQLAEIFDRHSK
jgi:glycosyltransferase involved in cell wall biosynthesis